MLTDRFSDFGIMKHAFVVATHLFLRLFYDWHGQEYRENTLVGQDLFGYNGTNMKRLVLLFSRKQRSVGAAAFVLMTMVFASRVLGLVRDRLLAQRFSPDELGIYFAAFRLPNLAFELLVMGALTSAFIPVFTRLLARKRDDAHQVASIVINIAVLVLVAIAIPLSIWTYEISRLIAPGFSEPEIVQMVTFTRLLLVAQVLPLMIGNFFTGILQSYKLFFIPALAPVVYNIGIIAGIVLLSETYGLYAPVIGVGVGAVLFMLIQFPLLLKVGYRHRASLDTQNAGVREIVRLMLPRTFGLAASQVDTTVDLMLASFLGTRMVTIFNFAQHLQYLPVGLFGSTVAQAALPTLSSESMEKNLDRFRATVISAIHQVLFFVLPVSALFIVLRIPMVRLVFGAARFDWPATVLTSQTLSAFSISLFAQSLVHVLARGFYALYDTKTPVLVGMLSIGINTVLSIVFIRFWQMPIWALGISTSIASTVNTILLLLLLNKRVHGFPKRELLASPIKMGIAAFLMAIMLYVPLKLFDQLVFDTTRTVGLVFLTGTASVIGLSTYLFLSWVFDVGEVESFFRLVTQVRKRVFLEPASEVVDEGGVSDTIT